jgi:hypothetical protein
MAGEGLRMVEGFLTDGTGVVGKEPIEQIACNNQTTPFILCIRTINLML